MWRLAPASRLLLRTFSSRGGASLNLASIRLLPPFPLHPFSSSSSSSSPAPHDFAPDTTSRRDKYQEDGDSHHHHHMSLVEAKKLMRMANVKSLKRRLEMEDGEVVLYSDLLKVCEEAGIVRSREEAVEFAMVLDDAGVVLVFRDKVFLYPDKVVDLMKKAVPLALTPENDPRRQEFQELQKKKDEIDVLAHKQVRRVLWSGLVFLVCQVSLFFRLTFWEFSWDVMEPIAFFTTTIGLIVGYAYFLFTSRDPTYQDLMHRLFLSRQRKLIQKHNFDIGRFLELQKYCKCPLDETGGMMVRDSFD